MFIKTELGWNTDRSSAERAVSGHTGGREGGRLRGTVGGWGMELLVDDWTVPVPPLARARRSERQDGFKNTTGRVRACGRRASREVSGLHLRVAMSLHPGAAGSPAWRRVSCPTCWPFPEMQRAPGHQRGVRMPTLHFTSKRGTETKPAKRRPGASSRVLLSESGAASPQVVLGALQEQKALIWTVNIL